MKKILISFSVFCFLFSVFWCWWRWASSPFCNRNCRESSFIVSKGEGLSSVASRLEKEKIIRSSLAFKILAAYNQIIKKVQAGDFQLNPKMTPQEILQELTHGTFDIRITIVEGWRREQIVEGLADSGFTNLNRQEFLEKTVDLEGQLFPDTYLFPGNVDAAKMIGVLTKNFQKKVGAVSKDTLILASMIEREVPQEEDRPVIAGILLRRLSAGWLLQVDATVQYAVAARKCEVGGGLPAKALAQAGKCDWWPKNLTKKDLEIKSPYNTYINRGLPPKPICSPGLSAIKAVLNPIQTDYWYYLSDKNGITHFAKTIEEQNQNIRRYLLE